MYYFIIIYYFDLDIYNICISLQVLQDLWDNLFKLFKHFIYVIALHLTFFLLRIICTIKTKECRPSYLLKSVDLLQLL